jgi:hypothetical protein
MLRGKIVLMIKLQQINADIIDDNEKEKKTCVRIKQVKSDSYLTYGQSCKTYMELYVNTRLNCNRSMLI